MGQNQVKRGDAESPERISLLDEDGGDVEDPSDPNKNVDFPLHLAACNGDLGKVEEVLSNGNANNSSLPDTSSTRWMDENERTPLHCATHPASSHNLTVVQLLLTRDNKEEEPLLANLQDASGKTALHYAAESKEPRLVSLLLRFGADPNLKDDEDCTPLHILAKSNSDSALECAELILDSPALSSSAGSVTNASGQTPAHVATICKAPKLLGLFVKQGFDSVSPDRNDPTYTPLILTCSKDDGDSKENLECVRILLDAYSPEQVNAKDERGITALIMAVWEQWHRIAELLVSSSKTDLFTKDSENYSVFHYAIWSNSLSSIKLLCESEQMSKEKIVEMVFLSHRPKKREGDPFHSPIEVALHFRNTKIVEYLLGVHPNPDKWMGDEVLMNLIYSVHPTTILPRMNQCLKYDAYDVVQADFRVITGVKDPVQQGIQETKYLYKINDMSDDERNAILIHPLVQMFLERKWERIRQLTWIHIFVQLSWVVSYTLMVYEMYAPDCHDTGSNQTTSGEMEWSGGGGSKEGKEHMRILHSLGFFQWEEDCRFHQTAVQCTAVILYLLSLVVLVKESFQIVLKPKAYFWDFINFVQLGLLVVAVVNSVPAWQLSSASELAPWQSNLAAIGVFVAWVMLLSELDNFPKCALYSAILKTVLWNCLKTLLFYCPLLIGFAMCFRILTPGKGQHKYLLFSLVKVVAMMTGELDFEDAFYGDDDTTSGPSTAYAAILGQIMFLLLLVVTTIVLLNLLTGLAVSDVGRLLEEAEVNRYFMQLERMHMIDSLVLLARQRLTSFYFWDNLLYRWSANAKIGEDKIYVYEAEERLKIRDFPRELQAKIRNVIGGMEDGGKA